MPMSPDCASSPARGSTRRDRDAARRAPRNSILPSPANPPISAARLSPEPAKVSSTADAAAQRRPDRPRLDRSTPRRSPRRATSRAATSDGQPRARRRASIATSSRSSRPRSMRSRALDAARRLARRRNRARRRCTLRSSGGGSRLGGANAASMARLRRAEQRPEQAGEAGAIERQIAADAAFGLRRFAGDRLRQRNVGIDRVGPRPAARSDCRRLSIPATAPVMPRQWRAGPPRKVSGRRRDRPRRGRRRRTWRSRGPPATPPTSPPSASPSRTASRLRLIGGRPHAAAPGEIGAGQGSRGERVEAEIPATLRRAFEMSARRRRPPTRRRRADASAPTRRRRRG